MINKLVSVHNVRFIGIFNRDSNSNIMNQTRLYGQTLNKITFYYCKILFNFVVKFINFNYIAI